MIDLHTHSLLSDGILLPSEILQQAKARKIEALAITDHVDLSNIDWVIPRLVNVCQHLKGQGVCLIPGVEITHVPPELISSLAIKARELGARIVIVHGETIVEPVPLGTNLAALNSDIDILAHPGLLTRKEAELAKQRGIALEITARKGHCLTNGLVAKMAQIIGARLILNTDAHTDTDLITLEEAEKIAQGAGVEDFRTLIENSKAIVANIKED
ncbi:histidinol phosphate phosphatase domain-containing protein [bacterium]|nr:histidinol phosphate phosphatase domain-containing protein [bacterium]MBU1752639.1 histidinol phosphate phosphatase domain-containing protein [bacterium]